MGEAVPIIRVLGGVEIEVDDVQTSPTNRLGRLLMRLLVDLDVAVSYHRIIEDMGWLDRSDPKQSLFEAVRGLRSHFPDGKKIIVQHGETYRLIGDLVEVDAAAFMARCAEGHERLRFVDHRTAASTFEAALGLWRGDAAYLGGEHMDAVQREIVRLNRARADAASHLAELAATSAVTDTVVDAVERVVRAHPTDARLVQATIRMLGAGGRHDHARQVRDRVVEAHAALALPVDAATAELFESVERRSYVAARRPTPTNLQGDPPPLLGRSELVDRVVELVQDRPAIVTLTGPAGVGVSETARAVAQRLMPEFEGGVWWLDMQTLGDPSAAPDALRQLLVESGAGDMAQAFGGDECLLVLDGCAPGHTVDREWVNRLFLDHRTLRLLLTAEEPVGVLKERHLEVPPLEVPPPEVPGSALRAFPIAELLDRTSGGLASELSDDDLRALVEVSNGFPSAAAMIGGWLRRENARAIASQPDALAMLPIGDRLAVASIAVFPADFSIRAARAVIDSEADARMERLVDLGIVQRSSSVPGRQLFRVSNGIRRDAEELLLALGHRADVEAALVDWLTAEVVEQDPADILAREERSVAIALDAAFRQGRVEEIVAIVHALGASWVRRRSRLGSAPWLSRATEIGAPRSRELSGIWTLRGLDAVRRGSFDEARTAFDAAVEIAIDVDAPVERGRASAEHAHLLLHLGECDNVERLDDADAAAREAGDLELAGRVTLLRAQRALYCGLDADAALEALATWVASAPVSAPDTAHAEVLLATRLQMRGDLDSARERARTALWHAESASDWSIVAFARYRWASIELHAGRPDDAVPLLRRGLDVSRELEHFALVASMLSVCAGVAHHRGRSEEADRLAAAHRTIRAYIGFALNRIDEMEYQPGHDVEPLTVEEAMELGWTYQL